MNIVYSYIPKNQSSFEEQFTNCMLQLDNTLANNNFDYNQIVKFSIFINSTNNISYIQKKNEIITLLKNRKNTIPISPSIIGQPPQDNKQIAMEVFIYEKRDINTKIIKKEYAGINYVLIDSSFNKELYVGGITTSNNFNSVYHQSKEVFHIMHKILEIEEMEFSDVVRQWNFIENILQISPNGVGPKQNYQIFNDVRTEFYNRSNYKNGYPAATGIGMSSGGVILEFIAVTNSETNSIIPLKNPRQIDAHQYTNKVLVGAGREIKATPKFERAKVLVAENCHKVFISGTAAILGENTINDNNVETQTEITIDNIDSLISSQNMNTHGILMYGKTAKEYIRVYVKDEKEIPKVKQVCQKRWGNIQALYLVSDICRDDLLVEIEGIGRISNSRVLES